LSCAFSSFSHSRVPRQRFVSSFLPSCACRPREFNGYKLTVASCCLAWFLPLLDFLTLARFSPFVSRFLSSRFSCCLEFSCPREFNDCGVCRLYLVVTICELVSSCCNSNLVFLLELPSPYATVVSNSRQLELPTTTQWLISIECLMTYGGVFRNIQHLECRGVHDVHFRCRTCLPVVIIVKTNVSYFP
jgi:hypothetical protein